MYNRPAINVMWMNAAFVPQSSPAANQWYMKPMRTQAREKNPEEGRSQVYTTYSGSIALRPLKEVAIDWPLQHGVEGMLTKVWAHRGDHEICMTEWAVAGKHHAH